MFDPPNAESAIAVPNIFDGARQSEHSYSPLVTLKKSCALLSNLFYACVCLCVFVCVCVCVCVCIY